MIQSDISAALVAAPGADSMALTRTPARLLGVAAAVYQEHRLVLGLALGYIAIGGLTLTTLHRQWPIEITNGPFALVWTALSMLWLCWQYLRSPKRLRRALAAPRVLGAILVALLVLPTQITLQSLKQSIGPVIGFRADPFLHRLDVLLHGQAAWLWLEPILARPWLVKSIDMLYMAWFLGLLVFVLWASWSRHRCLRQRALVAFLLLWIAGGTVMAGLVPSAGPCYYGQVVAGVDPYDKLITRLDSIGTEHGELRARFNQRMLWETRRTGRWKHFAGIAAMPSLHVGVSVLFVLVAWPMSRLLGSLLAVYAVAIQIGSVVLAWHYAVDGYLGAMIATGSWTVAGVLARRTGTLTSSS